MQTHRISQERQKRSKGAVFIEAGLTFVLFAYMLMGTFDLAQFLFIHQGMVDRARSAARWGAIADPTNTTSVQNMVLYNQAATPAEGTSGLFGLTSSMVSVTTLGSGTDDYRLVVTITNYPYKMISPIIGGTYVGPNIIVTIPLGLN